LLPKLAALWERIRTSLWFLPGIMILCAVLFAWLAVHVDIETDDSGSVWWLNQGGAGEAESLLGALLTALITMATLVISITMVVLTLAAAQLGPRLIRSFVGDRRTQAVLGLFIATVVYILLIFRLLDSELPKESVPHFAVTMASVLVLVCLLTLLFFLNHLARSIVADTVVNRVGQDLDRAIENNLRNAEDIPPLFAHYEDEPPALFGLSQSGYIQAVDYHALVAAAAEHDALIELLVRPGHHVLKDRTHARVWPEAALDDSLRDGIANALVVGRERTPVQDIEFSARQLVEVALRALSPGVNDPFTAIAVIDRIGASLASAMQRGDARKIWSDADGKVRLLAATSSFDGLVDLSFNQIRQASDAHPDVLIHLLDTLGALAANPRTEEQARALRRHMEAVMETGRRSISHSGDLAVLRERYEAALEAAGN
jgi:uncharacterized membrane protein